MAASGAFSPPESPAPPPDPARSGGRRLEFLVWSVLVLAVAAFAAGTVVLSDHESEVRQQRVLANEQRKLAFELGEAARSLGRDKEAQFGRFSDLRSRSLEMLARIRVDTRPDLAAQWERIVASLDLLGSARERILALSSGLEEVRIQGRDLMARSASFAADLAREPAEPAIRGMGEIVEIASTQLALELNRADLFDEDGLERAELLLDLYHRALASLRRADAMWETNPEMGLDLEGLAVQLESCAEGLDRVRKGVRELVHPNEELGALVRGSEEVQRLVSDLEAAAARAPAAFGTSLRAWLHATGLLALLALIGVVWRQGRTLRVNAASFELARMDAAESTSRLRRLLFAVLRAVDVHGYRLSATLAREVAEQELDDIVQETVGTLPQLITHRARRAIALSSIHESLGRQIALARSSLLTDSPSGDRSGALASVRQIEAALRDAGLHVGAALAREIRMAVEGGSVGIEAVAAAPEGIERASPDPGPVHSALAGGIAGLERCIDRAIAGERESLASLVFLINDLRAVGSGEPLPSTLGFDPQLPRDDDRRRTRDPELRAEAARVFPSVEEALDSAPITEGTTEELDVLFRNVRRLVDTPGDRRSPWRRFWIAGSAFGAALGDGSIPFGPAVRRLLNGLVEEMNRLSRAGDGGGPSLELFREILLYVALAESRHPELEAVRADFDLYREPLAFAEADDETPGTREGVEADVSDVSGDIIEQLEGIRATIDRVNLPPEPGKTN